MNLQSLRCLLLFNLAHWRWIFVSLGVHGKALNGPQGLWAWVLGLFYFSGATVTNDPRAEGLNKNKKKLFSQVLEARSLKLSGYSSLSRALGSMRVLVASRISWLVLMCFSFLSILLPLFLFPLPFYLSLLPFSHSHVFFYSFSFFLVLSLLSHLAYSTPQISSLISAFLFLCAIFTWSSFQFFPGPPSQLRSSKDGSDHF